MRNQFLSSPNAAACLLSQRTERQFPACLVQVQLVVEPRAMFVTARALLHQLMHFRRDIPPIPPIPHIATENRRECLSATASAERALSLILPYSNHTRAGSRSSLCKSHRNEAAIPDLAILRFCEQGAPYWCGQFLHEPGGHVRAIWEMCHQICSAPGLDRLIIRIKAVVLRFSSKVK